MAVRPSLLHRVYIQSLLSRRAMREDLALEMYKRAVGVCQTHDETFRPTHPTTQQGFQAFIHDLSSLLEELGMEVKRGREEIGKGKEWVVLVNNDPNDVALHATDLTPIEIAYYREVIQAIMTSYPANSIGSTHALRLRSELQGNMAGLTAQALLGSLTSRGWLAKSKRGRYSLAPRAMMELETYLNQEFEDFVQKCRKCEGMVLTGIVCDNGECDSHLHNYCLDTLRRSNRNSCPACKKSFEDQPPRHAGEKAVPRTEDEWRGEGGRKRKRASKGVRSSGDDEEDAEDDLEEEDGDGAGDSVGHVGAGPATWTASRSRRAKGTVIPETQPEDGVEDDEEGEEGARPSRRRR